jgi:hypothetical protein
MVSICVEGFSQERAFVCEMRDSISISRNKIELKRKNER